jgi:hypothetical protein
MTRCVGQNRFFGGMTEERAGQQDFVFVAA